MSGSLKDQLAAAQAATQTKLDEIGVDVSEISADVDTLLAGMNPGDVITADMVSAAESIRDRVTGIKDSLDTVNAKVPNTP